MNECREMMHIDKGNRPTKQPYSFLMHIDKCLRPIHSAKEDGTAAQLPDADCNCSTFVHIQWKSVQKEKLSLEEVRKAVPESKSALESDKADGGGFGQRKLDHCLFTVAQATSGP